jgi:S1-C subfamily serine protease
LTVEASPAKVSRVSPLLPSSARALGASLVACALALPSPCRADAPAPAAATPGAPIGFSKLLLRIDGKDEIGIGSAADNVRILERMRSKGFHAVGAENLVFGKDKSNDAEFVVGGTVRELVCDWAAGRRGCRVGIEWQVLDVERDEVVYSVLSRAAVFEAPLTEASKMGGLLLDGALDQLLERPAFRKTLASHTAPGGGAASSQLPTATLPRCAPGRKVAEGADDLLRTVVVVRGKSGFGSGFFVSPEGLVMTAAHVVDSPTLKLRLRDGTETDAVPVRVVEREDVALLRPVKPLTASPCAPIREDAPLSGAEVYAAGAPASLELAFSLTRGIVSGLPVIAGHRRLQTDASVSPGNSGGPLADASGAATGVVSFKIVSTKVEGVAFAVPMREALGALGLKIGDATDPSLLTTTAPLATHDDAVMRDTDDPIPSLDPEGDRRRAAAEESARQQVEEARIEDDRDRRTPTFARVMKTGGPILAAAGALGVIATYVAADPPSTTQAQYATFRTWNTVGWAAVGVGLGSFALSYAFRAPKDPPAAKSASVAVGIGASGIECRGDF